MKNYTYLLACMLFLFSCSKNETVNLVNPIVIFDNNKMLMFKLDYQTSQFEGGTELNFNTVGSSDSIPMHVVYNSPGDFGDVFIEHIPTGDSIFFGTIVWSGTGERIFPASLSDPLTFEVETESMDLPSDVSITYINDTFSESGEPEILDYSQMWNAINHLSKTQEYIANGAHIAILKYTPSVGIGDPDEWDWYVMLYQ